MSRYIDADALADKAKQYSLGCYEEDEWAVPFNEIYEAPSIDIVRCKECKHNWDGECTETNHLVNGMVAFDVLPDDFCSYGERKNDAD